MTAQKPSRRVRVTAREAEDARLADLTAPVEDYLKAIYEIELSHEAAATNDIAHRLQIAPASVSGMVRRLADQGLLAYERYRGVRLTDRGRRAALRTIRRHRVIEAYLVKALGYAWDEVHAEAERLEHSASDELVDRMAAAIGEPDTDPHGAPIPTREGVIDETKHSSLADLATGRRARVVRVGDENDELLRYLASLGIRPGVSVTLLDRAPFEGPLTVRVGQVQHQIGHALAGRILVEGGA
ncbi:MAG TPA: metal-dependent transcriptional regulator [Gemmatimonadaceae bacterium]|nr:metal-dependent transcriptional regulator [Gemmatimonadaceae bacterium]